MSEVKFKFGDLVYCPDIDNRVHTLESYDKHLAIYYNHRNNCEVFYFDGTSRKSYAPRIFHATQENYELLSKLYPNVTFEPPPKRKEPKDIIKAMLDNGWVGVACYVNDIDKRPSKNNKKDFIVFVKDDSFEYIYSGNYCNWKYANPFDPKTGKTIIDFIDGEVVLENENADE